MNDLETIENYLNGQLPADERNRFETALRTDSALADTLAFYVLARHTAKDQARAERKAEFDTLRRTLNVPSADEPVTVVRPRWAVPMRWAAAASIVLLLGLGWYFLRPGTDSATNPMVASQLVDDYAASHFREIPTTMAGGQADSLTLGINYFNKGQLAEADVVFGDVLVRQPDNDSALKYAGIVAYRRGNYDQAINQFNRLSQRTDLAYNDGTFLEALTLLKRGRPMDKDRAKKLLEEVIAKNLEGKAEATVFLNQLE